MDWMGGRVDEGGSLENYCTLAGTPGSNPGPSASVCREYDSATSDPLECRDCSVAACIGVWICGLHSPKRVPLALHVPILLGWPRGAPIPIGANCAYSSILEL